MRGYLGKDFDIGPVTKAILGGFSIGPHAARPLFLKVSEVMVLLCTLGHIKGRPATAGLGLKSLALMLPLEPSWILLYQSSPFALALGCLGAEGCASSGFSPLSEEK